MTELKRVEVVNGLMDMDQAASYLNVQKSTLYGLCMRKVIPVVKIGKLNRFRIQDLNRWIEAHIQESKSEVRL